MTPGCEKPWYLPALKSFILEDAPSWAYYYKPAEAALDYNYLERRVLQEGESFLTKTLPSMGKIFDYALQGRTKLFYGGFCKRKSNRSALPAFLHGLHSRVFEDDGTLRTEPCIIAIQLIRQLLLWCKKVEKEICDETIRKAVSELIDTNDGLPEVGSLPPSPILATASALCRVLFPVFPGLDRLRPKHGPGSVASTASPWKKRRSRISYKSLEAVFKPWAWFFSWRTIAEDYTKMTGRVQKEYGLSRTTIVPKDSSGPRVIGLEHAEYMWCQQALKGYMYDRIENHPLTKGRVNFTDQSINQELTKDWADYDTYDLKGASDRNSLELVLKIFNKTWILKWLLACRTPGTVLPDGRTLWFKMFAPMGSAVCFPVEAVVFYTLACAALHHLGGMPLFIATRKVRVYGDDLIIPHGYFDVINSVFEQFGLKLNLTKCCISGKFRESCGVDSFDGHNVTPLRMRKVHSCTNDASVSIVQHANNLMRKGYAGASRAFRLAALDTDLELKKRKLPSSPRDGFPILYWLDASSSCTVPKVIKNSITGVKGWINSSGTEVIPYRGADQEVLLLESLSRGGPVGRIRTAGKQRFRVFDKPYSGKLVYRKFIPCQLALPLVGEDGEGCKARP